MHRRRNQSPKVVYRPIRHGLDAGRASRLCDAPVEIDFATGPIVEALLATAKEKIARPAVRPSQSRSRTKNIERAVAEKNFMFPSVLGPLRRQRDEPGSQVDFTPAQAADFFRSGAGQDE